MSVYTEKERVVKKTNKKMAYKLFLRKGNLLASRSMGVGGLRKKILSNRSKKNKKRLKLP